MSTSGGQGLGDEDGVGVDTAGAEQSGTETVTLAQRYAGISSKFRSEMSMMIDASQHEMQVMTGAEEYCANVVGQLTRLQAQTGALGDSARAGAANARQADDEIGTGLGSAYGI